MPDISKVILNGVTQMDVTQDTVAPGNLLLNETATMSNGTRTVGTVDLSTYAPLNSPTFTGAPAAPTAAAGTNTTQIATTAFVHTDLANAIASEILWFSGQTVSAANNAQICRVPSSGTNSAITTNHVVSEVVFGNPAYITSDIGWETHSGYVTFTGTCTAATTVTFQLSRKGN